MRKGSGAGAGAVASRIGAAVLAGYALANTVPLALAAMLNLERAEVVLLSMQLAFPLHGAAVLWAFAARAPRDAWTVLTVPALLALCLLPLSSS